MSVLHAVLAFIVAQRLVELAIAARNTRRLRRMGAVEMDAEGYPAFILLHTAWLLALALMVPANAAVSWPLLGLFAVLQAGRVWVITSLGYRWTTRLIVLPEAPLVRHGPYRVLRHPNYLIVGMEIAMLPLAFGAREIAIVFAALNLALLARRIVLEDRALAQSAQPAGN